MIHQIRMSIFFTLARDTLLVTPLLTINGKFQEGMVMRHHNEAESLHAVQRMHWEWKLKEVGLCEYKTTPQIEDALVPIVHVSDDFDLLPA